MGCLVRWLVEGCVVVVVFIGCLVIGGSVGFWLRFFSWVGWLGLGKL